jgi:hypothetical protein
MAHNVWFACRPCRPCPSATWVAHVPQTVPGPALNHPANRALKTSKPHEEKKLKQTWVEPVRPGSAILFPVHVGTNVMVSPGKWGWWCGKGEVGILYNFGFDVLKYFAQEIIEGVFSLEDWSIIINELMGSLNSWVLVIIWDKHNIFIYLYLILYCWHYFSRIKYISLVLGERIETIWPRGGWIGLHTNLNLFCRKTVRVRNLRDYSRNLRTRQPPRINSELPRTVRTEHVWKSCGLLDEKQIYRILGGT